MISLQPSEQILEGRWISVGEKVIADETVRRIEELVSTYLTKLAESDDGWENLYVDEKDGRKWELTYPHTEWHGGGPPTLRYISDSDARAKYRT